MLSFTADFASSPLSAPVNLSTMSEATTALPENDIGQSHFDVTVVGTGLSESIAAS